MSDSALVKFYHKYLHDQDTASFIRRVSLSYTNATLESLAHRGCVAQRRAAVLALGFLGHYSSNRAIGRALRDQDRGVRLAADVGIRHIWCRAGNGGERQLLARIERGNAGQQHTEALRLALQLCQSAPHFAEAWKQSGIARFCLGQPRLAMRDCQRAFQINPFQFEVAVGVGNCHMRLGDISGALDWWQRAVRINPELERVRQQIRQLTRSLEQP